MKIKVAIVFIFSLLKFFQLQGHTIETGKLFEFYMGNFQKNIRLSGRIQEDWGLSYNFLQHTHYNSNIDAAIDSVIVESITQVLLIYQRYSNGRNIIELLDDGNHFDNEPDDGIYGNYVCGNFDDFKTDEASIDVRWDSLGVNYHILGIPVNYLPEFPYIITPLHHSTISSGTPEIRWEIDSKADGCGVILLGSTPILGQELENIIWQKEYRSNNEEVFIDQVPITLQNNKLYTLVIWSYTNSKQIDNSWNKGAYSIEWSEFSIDTLQKHTNITCIQNSPNPFSARTIIEYSIPVNAMVSIKIFNILGQKIITLVDQEQMAGDHYIIWDGKDSFGNNVSSGVYLCNMLFNTKCFSKKLLLTR